MQHFFLRLLGTPVWIHIRSNLHVVRLLSFHNQVWWIGRFVTSRHKLEHHFMWQLKTLSTNQDWTCFKSVLPTCFWSGKQLLINWQAEGAAVEKASWWSPRGVVVSFSFGMSFNESEAWNILKSRFFRVGSQMGGHGFATSSTVASGRVGFGEAQNGIDLGFVRSSSGSCYVYCTSRNAWPWSWGSYWVYTVYNMNVYDMMGWFPNVSKHIRTLQFDALRFMSSVEIRQVGIIASHSTNRWPSWSSWRFLL